MIHLFTAVLIACSGPAPERCVDIDLGTYPTSSCVVPAMPAAAEWVGDNPAWHVRRLECRAGERGA